MLIDDFILARLVHVVSIVGWIGGVWFVTFVVIPALGRSGPEATRLARFHQIEAGFAPQARIWVLFAGVSGFWMTWRADLWHRFLDLHYWWMHAMLGLWTLFFVMLFVLEPLVLHRRMAQSPDPVRDFARLARAHRVLSVLALITVAGAMGGAHGLW